MGLLSDLAAINNQLLKINTALEQKAPRPSADTQSAPVRATGMDPTTLVKTLKQQAERAG